MTPIIERQRARLNIYIKQKNCETIYIYKNQDTLQKQDNLPYVFIQNKSYTLRYAIFYEIFEISIYIETKSIIPAFNR